MTINIFVLKGDLNGKIVVVRFFFCWVYISFDFSTNIKHTYMVINVANTKVALNVLSFNSFPQYENIHTFL